jgi:hypothetical protein
VYLEIGYADGVCIQKLWSILFWYCGSFVSLARCMRQLFIYLVLFYSLCMQPVHCVHMGSAFGCMCLYRVYIVCMCIIAPVTCED